MSSYYAIVNLNSESVKGRLSEIESCLAAASERLGAPIHTDYREAFREADETWGPVDRQFEKAKTHTHVFVFGGDGTQTHVLSLIAAHRTDLVFVGILCGTMNINALSNRMEALASIRGIEMTTQDAIACRAGERTIGYAVIDAVITTTCVARLNGRISQISAEAILRGEKRHAIPERIGNAATRITVNSQKGAMPLPAMDRIYTIAAAMLPCELRAKTMAGGADPAACAGFSWGVILSDFPLVHADATKEELQAGPITSVFYPLAEGDTVTLTDLCDNAFLINDGNAVAKIDSISFSYAPSFFKIGRIVT